MNIDMCIFSILSGSLRKKSFDRCRVYDFNYLIVTQLHCGVYNMGQELTSISLGVSFSFTLTMCDDNEMT